MDQGMRRMMRKIYVECATCGHMNFGGTRLIKDGENVIPEDVIIVEDESSIDNFERTRLYFKCAKCSAEFTVKGPPQVSLGMEEIRRRYPQIYAEFPPIRPFPKLRLGVEETRDAMETLSLEEKQKLDNKVNKFKVAFKTISR